MLDALFVTLLTALTKANKVYISVVGFIIPLADVLQSTLNRINELIELWFIRHVLPCLLQEF